MHLREYPTSAYNDIILDACLDNDVFDQQMNGDRGWYLHQMMVATGEPLWFRDRLISELKGQTPNDRDDNSLVAELLDVLAQHGDAAARQTLYAALERDPTWDRVQEAIVRLDGLDGLVTVARAVGFLDIEPTGECTGQPDDALYQAEELFDEAEIWERLEAKAITDPAVRKYIGWMRPDFLPFSRVPRRAERPYISFDEFEASVGRPLSEQINPRWWGIQASGKDLGKAAQKVLELPANDYAKLRRYLWVFLKRTFPLNHQPLIDLADSPDERIAWWAINALDNISHPDVRELAFRLRGVEDRRQRRWIGLLANNYLADDYVLFEQAILDETDEETIHSYGMDIEQTTKEHGRTELALLLVLLYDRDPCGTCRDRFVRLLHELDQLPLWMIEESRFDADRYLREFIEEIAPCG